MLFKKKNRYKPSYKIIIKLRENVQNKTKLFKFKKQKWQKFLNFLKKKIKPYKKYRPQDQNIYLVSKYPVKGLYYKKRFKNSITAIKRFSYFYGGVLKNKIKKLISHKNLRNNLFLENFEKRIDVVLFRSKFCISIRNSRQLISHGKVSINNNIIKDKSYVLKRGDFISINKKDYKLIKNNLLCNLINNNFWPIPPKYLTINYKTMQIIFGHIKNINGITSLNSNFNLNLEKILQNYKKH